MDSGKRLVRYDGVIVGYVRSGRIKSLTQPLPATPSGRKLVIRPLSALRRRIMRQGRSSCNQDARKVGGPSLFGRGLCVLGSLDDLEGTDSAPSLRWEVYGLCLSCALGDRRRPLYGGCLRARNP